MERSRATCMMHENDILMYSAGAHNPYHGFGQSLQVKRYGKIMESYGKLGIDDILIHKLLKDP